MIFLSLIVVLILVQWWGSGAPLQHDKWFLRWLDILPARGVLKAMPAFHLALAIGIPAALLTLVVWGTAVTLSASWLFFINVPVLLYSLGRGNFSAEVKHYIAASENGDNVMASKLIDDLRGDAEAEPLGDTPVNDWRELHTEALQVISYRGFERMFAVLFWFAIFGAVGALVYRLSVIYRERVAAMAIDNRLAAKWLWLIEWPAVRVMGLTWALVGNFDTCFRCWQSRLLDTQHSSMTLLNSGLRGALGVDDPMVKSDCAADVEAAVLMPNEPAYSLSLVKASVALFSRALLFWVCAIAVVTILT